MMVMMEGQGLGYLRMVWYGMVYYGLVMLRYVEICLCMFR